MGQNLLRFKGVVAGSMNDDWSEIFYWYQRSQKPSKANQAPKPLYLSSILIRILFDERLILKCLFIIETLERHVIFELLFHLPGFFYISEKCALCNQFLFEATSQDIFEIVIARDSVGYALISVAFGGWGTELVTPEVYYILAVLSRR